jgi:apolipoprotein N-acyltransferase
MKKIYEGFKKYQKLLLSGAVCGFAFAPTFLFFTFFWGFKILLDNLFRDFKNNGEIFFVGFIWGYGYFLTSFYWVVNPLLFDFPRYMALIPLALIGVPSFLGCYIGIIFLILYKIKQRFLFLNKFLLSVIFAVLWTIFELCKSYLFFPFPFNLIAYSLGFSVLLIQTVSLFGSYIFGFFATIIYCGYFIFEDKKFPKYETATYFGAVMFIIVFGIFKNFEEKKYDGSFNVNIRLIQPNFDEKTKNDPEKRDFIIEKLKNYIDNNSDHIDAVFLPESALPFIINSEYYNRINFGRGKTILSGAIRVHENKIFNSIVMFKNGYITDYYDKYHLVPFGEYLPLRKILPSSIKNFIGIDFSRGDKNKNLLDGDRLGKISPTVCYEALFNDIVNKKANLIVNLTNDIWLGSTVGAYQHFNALKFRAVENRLPVVRVSNNGISGYINKYGRIIVKTRLNRETVMDLRI